MLASRQHPAALDDPHQDHHQRHGQEDVYEPSHRVRSDQPKPPQHQENYCNRPQHDSLVPREAKVGFALVKRFPYRSWDPLRDLFAASDRLSALVFDPWSEAQGAESAYV
jgi:hypothetical protein